MPTATALQNTLIGTPVRIVATYRNLDDVLADPTTVSMVVRKPDGTETSYDETSMLNPSVGVWTLVVPTDQAGQWIVNCSGVGNDVDVNDEATFVVRNKRT